MDTITLTKEQLKSALSTWEQAHRDGGTLGRVETAAKPVEQVASESSDYLWGLLTQGAEKEAPHAH